MKILLKTVCAIVLMAFWGCGGGGECGESNPFDYAAYDPKLSDNDAEAGLFAHYTSNERVDEDFSRCDEQTVKHPHVGWCYHGSELYVEEKLSEKAHVANSSLANAVFANCDAVFHGEIAQSFGRAVTRRSPQCAFDS